MYIGLERKSNPSTPEIYKFKYNRFNWLLFIDVKSWNEKRKRSLRWMAFPFIYYKTVKTAALNNKQASSKSRLNILGVFDHERKLTDGRKSRRWFVFPLAYYKSQTARYNYSDKQSLRFYSPLWFYNKRYTDYRNPENPKRNRYNKKKSLFLPIPLLYVNTERTGKPGGAPSISYTRINLAGFLFDYKHTRGENYNSTRWFFFPLVYYKGATGSGKTNYSFLTPLFMSWRKPGQRKLFIAGLYLNNSTTYRRQNFLFLYDHQSLLDAKIEKYSMLFGSVHMENGPDTTKFYLMYRLLFGVNYSSSRKHNVNVLWWYTSRSGDRILSHFMPFYYYERNSSRSVFFSPLLLRYARSDKNGIFQLFGAGLIWYRNYDALTGKDDKLLLGGLLYQEKHRRERGYSSYGSLWGFAWKYQKEKETGWKKFTLLSVLPVYKRVINQGTEYKYIMGIRGKGRKP